MVDYVIMDPNRGQSRQYEVSDQEMLARMAAGGYSPSTGMLTSTGGTASAPNPDQIFDPLDSTEGSDDGGIDLGYWLLEQVDKFYGPEYDVGDTQYSPEEIEEIQELFRRLRAGEPVDLSEIQEFYPDLYEYLSQQPDFESYFGDDGGYELLPAPDPNDQQSIRDLLSELGYSDETIQDILDSNVIDANGVFVGNPVLENILVQNGYDGSAYAVEPTGTPGVDLGGPDEPEPEPESTDSEPFPTLEEAVEQIQEEFPTWEDLWSKIKDVLPSDAQEWGDAIRGVFEAAGIPLPSGDIWDILNGGYGVTTTINPATGGIAGILDPDNLLVFIPGIPVGLPPSSTIIGSIEDLVTDPIGTITEKVERVLGDIVSDPGGFVEGILSGALEVPNELWEMILGGVAIGQDLLDWLVDSGVELIEETTPEPPLGGEEPEPEVPEEAAAFDRIEDTADLLEDFTSIFADTIPDGDPEQEEVEEGFDRTEQVLGILPQIIGAVPDQEQGQQVEEEVVSGDGEEGDGFTFGGGSSTGGEQLSQEEVENIMSELGGDFDDFVGVGSEDTLDEPVPEEEQVLSGGASSGGGGGGGGAGTKSNFMARLNYVVPEVAPIIPTSPSIVASLFSEYLS